MNDRIAILEETLRALAYRHEWAPTLGPCICEEHQNARALLGSLRPKQEPWMRIEASHQEIIDTLRPLMERIRANPGQYAGDAPGDYARRVVGTIKSAGYKIIKLENEAD